MRDDAAGEAGDHAITDSIDPQPVKVRLASDEVKDALLDTPVDLFKWLFVVDVDVTEVEGRPVLYRVPSVKASLDRTA